MTLWALIVIYVERRYYHWENSSIKTMTNSTSLKSTGEETPMKRRKKVVFFSARTVLITFIDISALFRCLMTQCWHRILKSHGLVHCVCLNSYLPHRHC